MYAKLQLPYRHTQTDRNALWFYTNEAVSSGFGDSLEFLENSTHRDRVAKAKEEKKKRISKALSAFGSRSVSRPRSFVALLLLHVCVCERVYFFLLCQY